MASKYEKVCPGCKERFDIREGYIKSTTRYWHPKCYEAKQIEKEATTERDLGRQAIFNYLTEVGFEPNYVRWGQQISKFRREGYTDVGILLTLKYWFEIKQGDIAKANGGMGIVPFIYQDAQRYYHSILQKQAQLEQEMERFANEDKKVIKLMREENKVRRLGYIDFDSI